MSRIDGLPELAVILGERLDLTVAEVAGLVRFGLRREFSKDQESELRTILAWSVAMAAAAGLAHRRAE